MILLKKSLSGGISTVMDRSVSVLVTFGDTLRRGCGGVEGMLPLKSVTFKLALLSGVRALLYEIVTVPLTRHVFFRHPMDP